MTKKAALKTALLVGPLASSAELKSVLKKRAFTCVIAVDGGLKYCEEAGVSFDFGVGDWDSYGEMPDYPESKLLRLRREKDQSDLCVALDFVKSVEMDSVVLIGFQGGRSDHELSNHLECARFSEFFQSIESSGAETRVVYLGPGKVFEHRLAPRTLISLFPLGSNQVSFDEVSGLKYPPERGVIKTGSSGLSNLVSDENVRIVVKKGHLGIFLPTERKL